MKATTGSLTFLADGVVLAPTVSGGTKVSAVNGSVTFAPFTAARPIELIGATTADPASLSLSAALLSDVSALGRCGRSGGELDRGSLGG